MADFNTWSTDNLAKFAAEANDKLNEQNQRITDLQQDLKDAIKAYRELLLKGLL